MSIERIHSSTLAHLALWTAVCTSLTGLVTTACTLHSAKAFRNGKVFTPLLAEADTLDEGDLLLVDLVADGSVWLSCKGTYRPN